MWVTLALLTTALILLGLVTALGVSLHRKLDEALKSLSAPFKFD